MKHLCDLVTIGIATKNRWQDLSITLEKIRSAGWSELSIFIFDDNSDQPCSLPLSDLGTKIELKRFNESQGYIARRNQLARSIQTKYYLSLDDDSFPVSDSLQAAVEFMEATENCFCLSFPVYNPVLNEHQSRSLQSTPYPVKFFIGCGHLLRRDKFLELGGYCEDLIHQGEEMDIAARAFKKGLYCYHFPEQKMHHIASNAGRNWHRMDFYGARNNVLWNDWYIPSKMKFYKQVRTLVSRILLSIKVKRTGQIKGEWSGFKDIKKYIKMRNNMSFEEYKLWNNLPSS